MPYFIDNNSPDTHFKRQISNKIQKNESTLPAFVFLVYK